MDVREYHQSELERLTSRIRGYLQIDAGDVVLTDEEVKAWEDACDKAEKELGILEAIDEGLAMVRAEQARHSLIPDADMLEVVAQKSDTLELLNETARHLSGTDVEVRIEQPRVVTWGGACVWRAEDSNHAIKIQISPQVTADAEQYMTVFLHEVAHAKLHREGQRNEDTAETLEMEADRQARIWKHYAKKHSHKGMDAGGVNVAANDFRLQLLALLRSDEAANMVTFLSNAR